MELINHYCHGYVAIPVILNLEQKNVFAYLEQRNRTLEELCDYFDANSGGLNVALNLLLSMGWLRLESDTTYALTEQASFRHKIPQQLLNLYHFSTAEFMTHAHWQDALNLIYELHLESSPNTTLLCDMVKGVVLAPLLLSLDRLGVFKDKGLAESSQNLLGKNFIIIRDLFIKEKWLDAKSPLLNYMPLGAYLFKRISLIAVTVSYQPMFAKLDKILFGDVREVFGLSVEEGHEQHVDRQLNVMGSGAQHGMFFEQFKLQVVKLFQNTNFASQPAYIADMGCGDGSLLKALYTTIITETPRGGVIDTYPLIMIGADFNQASLKETIKTMTEHQIPHLIMKADIADPQQFIKDIERHAINPEHILHVRSFLDHDRPYIEPDLNDAHVRNQVALRKRFCHEGVFVDQEGRKIVPEVMIQSLVEHLGRWAKINMGHGLILSEVHYLPPNVVHSFISESENLSFDACQGFSKQYLVTMKDFLISAAENHLFTSIETFTAFPKRAPFCRINCLRLEKKSYKIRYAHLEDIHALIELEERCWEEGLRNSPDTIRQRLQVYPQGHWVLEVDEQMIGVVYTQRFDKVMNLCNQSDRTVDLLHQDQGKVLQILNIFVDPARRASDYGSVLRDFVLLMAKVTPGITEVIGVTRCESYTEHRKLYVHLSEYIHAKDQINLPLDPMLNFHVRRGAHIAGLIANYRQNDLDNNRAGVLVRYNLENIFVSH